MAIFKLTQNNLAPLAETQFGAEGILERKDLQRLLQGNIRALASDLMVICEEFGSWVESSRRIDLLCIDREANLVVVELKRTEDGGHMELQAIRYAAMISAMKFEQLMQVEARAATAGLVGPLEDQDLVSTMRLGASIARSNCILTSNLKSSRFSILSCFRLTAPRLNKALAISWIGKNFRTAMHVAFDL